MILNNYINHIQDDKEIYINRPPIFAFYACHGPFAAQGRQGTKPRRFFYNGTLHGLHAQSNGQQTKCEDTSLFPPLARVQNTNNSARHGTVNRLQFESASFYGAFKKQIPVHTTLDNYVS